MRDAAFTLNEKRQRFKYMAKIGRSKSVMKAARQLETSHLLSPFQLVPPQNTKAPILVFAVQYACAMCWIDAGLTPRAVGILSLRDALKLVASRGRLVLARWGPQRGAMLALSNCSIDDFGTISLLLSHPLEIACHNAPTSLIAVGPATAITACERLLATTPSLNNTIRSQRLSTSHGFHSSLVEPILQDLTAVARSLTWNKPAIPLETCTQDPAVLLSASGLITDPAEENKTDVVGDVVAALWNEDLFLTH
ncbi:hypothetical protein B0H66DRAFT_602433 [Apodospora peruviana]|uniref:Malonyl-CoA:ACP transacylase (MAT) domain-containing protein n=1 Tax=Apodospora peruviana TaxID=516989 RepID=A0AAE0IDF3_9PEZI|nr:hypothetical protein B0H66DRAFT_602433 [Apodospora peruviana]